MAARKRGRIRTRTRTVVKRVGKARGKIGSFFKRGMVGETTSALGASVVTTAITDRVVPQISPYAAVGAEYMAGGATGAILAEIVKSAVGMPSILGNFNIGNILGGGQQQSVGAMV